MYSWLKLQSLLESIFRSKFRNNYYFVAQIETDFKIVLQNAILH